MMPALIFSVAISPCTGKWALLASHMQYVAGSMAAHAFSCKLKGALHAVLLPSCLLSFCMPAGHHPQRSRLSIGGGGHHSGPNAAEAAARMEAATLAGLVGNAAIAPGRFAVPSQGQRPAQQPGLLQSPEETSAADSAVLSALPYAQRLRRVGRSRLY